ncbi:LORF2 protein, partial [Crocuta crocuta]
CWWECKMVQPLWELLRKLKSKLPYHSAIPLLYIHRKELKAGSQRFAYHIFIYPLFFSFKDVDYSLSTIAKTWKEPKCPLTDKWIKKMWSIYTMEYYMAMRKNEIWPCVATWMELEGVMLSEISQAEKNRYHMFAHIEGL